MIANTGGQTKKSAVLSVYNAFNAIGSIIGPLLFSSDDAPRYLPGIRAVLGVFAAMMAIALLCFFLLFVLNKQREKQRVAVGKPAKLHDTSMTSRYETYQTTGGLGEFGELLSAFTAMMSMNLLANNASGSGCHRFQEQRVCLCLLSAFTGS